MSTVFEFVNFSPTAVLLIDEKIKIKASSKSIYAMFGLPSLISGRKKIELGNLFNKQGRLIKHFNKCIKDLTRTGSQDSFTWSFEGKVYYVSLVAIRVDHHRYFSIHFDDVSYKYKMDSPLELTRSYLNDIINHLPVGVIVLDKNYHIYMLNTKQLEYFQFNNPSGRLENYLGFHISQCLTEDSVNYWSGIIASYISQKTQIPLQKIHKVRDLVFNCTISSFSLTDDNNRAIMIVSENITEAYALEEKLRIAEEKATQLKTLKEINVSIRHEVFNVVTPLSMNAELLMTCLDPVNQAEEVEMVDSILQSTQRLITFVKQLIEIKEVKIEDYIEGDDSLMITY